jgi:hypothetical protein
MPIDITRLEPGIYRAHLHGLIQLDEALATQANGKQLAQAHGDARYVLIVEVDPATDMPFDIRNAGQVIRSNEAAQIYVVGATLHIRLLLKLLGGLFGFKDFTTCKTLDDALTRARAVLATPSP